MEITIYHNPRCSKSRQGLAILQNQNKPFKIINYIENPLSKLALIKIIELLKIQPIDLVRKNEAIWKENYKNKTLTNEQIIDALANHPKLIERPIVINNNKAVIGRPPETINTIL